MKTLLILAFTIALAVSAVPPNLNKYLPNKEYVYEYESEALTGIPAASSHAAGIKVLAKVHLQLKGANKYLLALRDVSVCEVNEKALVHHFPVDSGKACAPIQAPEIANELKENLVKPIRFRWENGQVSLLQTDVSDAFWSVNLKRGLLSILHINLQELEALPAMPKALLETIVAAVPSAGQRTLSNFFRVMEKDIVGECETIYAIQEEPAQTPVLIVTKVRNFDSCVSRPVFQNGILAALDCHACSARLPLRSQASVNYTLTGNRQEFVINEAVQMGHFVFKPLSSVDGQAITFTKQKLVLVDVPEIASEIPLGKKREQKDPFIFEWPLPITELAHPAPAPGPHAPEAVALFEQRINAIVNAIESPDVSQPIPQFVAELVIIAGKLPLPALEEIVKKLVAVSPDPVAMKKRELILDILPMAGRSDIAPLLHKLVQENIICTVRAAYIVNVVALTTTPSPVLIKELLELYPAYAKMDAQLARSIVLAAGALTNTLNKVYHSTNVPQEIAIPARSLIVKAFKNLLESASARNEKLLVLKALGNAGLAEFIPLVVPVIQDTKALPEVRAKAIYALRRVTPLAKHMVHQICLPVIMTPEEPLEVRMAALLITVHTRPESGVFTVIAKQIAKDPSVQFTNFAYSLMKAIAQSSLPCNQNISEAAGAAIRDVYTIYNYLPMSKVLNFDIIASYIHHLGAEIALDIVTPSVSTMPETIVANVNAYFAKSLFNVFEVGVESKGVLTILRNLFGPENQWMRVLEGKISLADIVSPLLDPSTLDMESIRTFLSGISERDLAGFAADIYFKLFGHELRFFTLDNNYIKEKIRELEGSEGDVISKLAAGVPFDILKTVALPNHGIIVPTPNGLPVSLNLTAVTVISTKGSLKLDGITSLAQLMTGNPTVNICYDIEPKIVSSVMGAMSVELGLVAASTALRAEALIKTPLKGTIKVELPSYKVHVTAAAPTQEETVMKVEVAPVARIIRAYPTPTTKFHDFSVTPLYNPEIVIPVIVELPILRETLGIEAVIKGKYAMPIAPLAPLRILCMPHELEVVIRPAPGAPESFEFIAAYVDPATAAAAAIKKSILSVEAKPASNSWFSSRSAPSSIEFEPVVPEPSIAGPITRQLVVALVAKGPSPKHAAAQVTIISAAKMEKIQADIQFAMKADSAAPAIYKIETVINVPAVLTKSAPVPTTPEQIAVVRIAYGPQGHTTEYVTVKTLYRVLQTTETQYIKEAIINGTYFYYFEKVDASYSPHPYTRASRYSYPGVAAEPAQAALRPLQFILDIEYKPVPIPAIALPVLNRLYYKVLDMPAYWFYPKGAVLVMPAANAPLKCEATITTLPNTGTFDMLVKLPTEEVLVQGIPLPWPSFFQQSSMLVKKIAGEPVASANCTIRGEVVRTFDKVSYTLPSTTCEVILAQDCTSKKLFRVTHQHSPVVPSKKIAKLYVGADIIEIEPTASWGSRSIAVKVNAAPKVIPEDTPVEIIGSKGGVVGTIIKKGELITVIETKLGLKVVTNGHFVHVQLPVWFSGGQVCGMCGNYDTEKVGDVRGPANQMYPRPENAIVDYIIPAPGCDAAQLIEKFKATVAQQPGSCAPQPATVYMEHTESNEKFACFSDRPAMICPASCRAVSQKSVEMPFHCVPADTPAAHDMLNRMKAGPLPPLADAPKTIQMPVLISPECQRPQYY